MDQSSLKNWRDKIYYKIDYTAPNTISKTCLNPTMIVFLSDDVFWCATDDNEKRVRSFHSINLETPARDEATWSQVLAVGAIRLRLLSAYRDFYAKD